MSVIHLNESIQYQLHLDSRLLVEFTDQNVHIKIKVYFLFLQQSLIYVTAPKICENYLIESFKVFESVDSDFVFSTSEFSSPIFHLFTILTGGIRQTKAYSLIDILHDGDG